MRLLKLNKPRSRASGPINLCRFIGQIGQRCSCISVQCAFVIVYIVAICSSIGGAGRSDCWRPRPPSQQQDERYWLVKIRGGAVCIGKGRGYKIGSSGSEAHTGGRIGRYEIDLSARKILRTQGTIKLKLEKINDTVINADQVCLRLQCARNHLEL
jgi:hypothetical protein